MYLLCMVRFHFSDRGCTHFQKKIGCTIWLYLLCMCVNSELHSLFPYNWYINLNIFSIREISELWPSVNSLKKCKICVDRLRILEVIGIFLLKAYNRSKLCNIKSQLNMHIY
jgi:hypothetical protein